MKVENRYSALDTESDPEDGTGDIDDFDPPNASQSSKMPFIFLPMRPYFTIFRCMKSLTYKFRKKNVFDYQEISHMNRNR